MTLLRVGSRESPLALVQTKWVMAQLQAAWPELTLELKTFKTQGDIILDTSLSKIGDKGLFVKELEVALLLDEIDIAVHSMKDLPGVLHERLALCSVGEREDPRDVLLAPSPTRLQELPPGAVVGTSSLRRIAQFKRLRPDLDYQTIRGNLQTRLRKMEEGQYQAIILAAAGVHRLDWHDRIVQYFDPITESIPAVCQGILAVEFRQDDPKVDALLSPMRIPDVETAMAAERSFLRTLEGGCQVPVGGYAHPDPTSPGQFNMHGIALTLEGEQAIRQQVSFPPEAAVQTGKDLAETLLLSGGQVILDNIRLFQPNSAR